ncbi:hypothetical protein ACH5RR_021966 [Cinchona calisaya]|uniref:Uncharacterized protein n=1 Tax=Cinchona calisaya TaxID=153742 RepID=A0ABD2Z883_9GENT
MSWETIGKPQEETCWLLRRFLRASKLSIAGLDVCIALFGPVRLAMKNMLEAANWSKVTSTLFITIPGKSFDT